MTVRLEPSTRASLAAYIDVHQWQLVHIKQGLREAQAGHFASDTQVQRTLAKLHRK